MTQADWLEYFETVYKRKPTPEEFMAARERGEFLVERPVAPDRQPMSGAQHSVAPGQSESPSAGKDWRDRLRHLTSFERFLVIACLIPSLILLFLMIGNDQSGGRVDAVTRYRRRESLVSRLDEQIDELREDFLAGKDYYDDLTAKEQQNLDYRVAKALVDQKHQLGLKSLTLADRKFQEVDSVLSHLVVDSSDFQFYTGIDSQDFRETFDDLVALDIAESSAFSGSKVTLALLDDSIERRFLPSELLALSRPSFEQLKNLAEDTEYYLEEYLGSDYYDEDGDKDYSFIEQWKNKEVHKLSLYFESFWTEEELAFMEEQFQRFYSRNQLAAERFREEFSMDYYEPGAWRKRIRKAYFLDNKPMVYSEYGSYVATYMVDLGDVVAAVTLDKDYGEPEVLHKEFIAKD